MLNAVHGLPVGAFGGVFGPGDVIADARECVVTGDVLGEGPDCGLIAEAAGPEQGLGACSGVSMTSTSPMASTSLVLVLFCCLEASVLAAESAMLSNDSLSESEDDNKGG